ncbi:MAG: NAD-dependent epimerase/dehydratase family protein [Deltaproteobacteria bacterium]|nr:NAD-dependent epimerase/dehydratase family protein [Deltaproteobacteria bacterium]
MRRVIVTGADGFIGHHFVEHVLVGRPDWHVDALCSFHHGGIGDRLARAPRIGAALADGRVRVHTVDLTRAPSRQMVAALDGADFIVNFASRSHVDTSLAEPAAFFRDNVDVALTLLDLARALGPRVFVQISTDEVYGPAHGRHAHVEWEPHVPSNPYAASKAAQEAAAIAWWRAYRVPVVITNTMNNIGERQSAEKFVPMVMRRVLSGEPVGVHAIPTSEGWHVGSRYYMHARNHADAILFLLEHYERDFPFYAYQVNERPPRFHIAGELEVDNLTLAQRIADTLGRPLLYDFVDAHSSRPGHDLRYALSSQALHDLGWRAPVSFWQSLERTVRWTAANPEWLLD